METDGNRCPSCGSPLRPDGRCILPIRRCANGWERASFDAKETGRIHVVKLSKLVEQSRRSDRPPPQPEPPSVLPLPSRVPTRPLPVGIVESLKEDRPERPSPWARRSSPAPEPQDEIPLHPPFWKKAVPLAVLAIGTIFVGSLLLGYRLRIEPQQARASASATAVSASSAASIPEYSVPPPPRVSASSTVLKPSAGRPARSGTK